MAHTLDSLGLDSNLIEIKQEDIPPVETVSDVAISQEEINYAAKESLDFLAAIAIPLVYQFAFPPVFLGVWDWLKGFVHKKRDFSQLLLGLPRGFGKTMIMKLFILYCILFTEKKFILILCETQTKANNIIADVCDMLNEPNIIKAFGDWKLGIETDRQDLKKFGYRGRNIILMGAGAESGIRGITLKNERPDVMLFDDIQSRDNAESLTQSDKLEREVIGTCMKAKSPHGCLFIYVGNMYPTKFCILRKLKYNPNWVKFIAGGILADGTSLWEELQPIEQLKKEFQNDLAMGRPEIFYSEVLNDENASPNNLIDLSALPSLPYREGDLHQGNFIVIDPSGQKTNSDRTAIGYFEVYDSYPVLKSLIHEKLSPGDTIAAALKLCLENNCRLIAIESVAYQASLCYWFQFICQQRSISGIEAVEIYPGGYSKNARILEMLRSYAKGELFVSDECKPHVHLQITQWNPLKRDNVDDVLDLLTYCRKVIEMFGEYIIAYTTIVSQEGDAIEVIGAGHNSCF